MFTIWKLVSLFQVGDEADSHLQVHRSLAALQPDGMRSLLKTFDQSALACIDRSLVCSSWSQRAACIHIVGVVTSLSRRFESLCPDWIRCI
ncbi:hypothetical protein MPTK1_4g10880 [Marchantia polymorpha subsp. ruderalis]|uniref:Uncharacterized protein n=2 Tax=Marchantia polymorpha TaxID=3197 RepID=A0AAF6B8M0_MARPO|nr:hypothetical protein MARPO_0011s0074 [Marchantia polymorpha]BBN08354.1 hypothetical protein Mp_4g10880 [Marchantia polymorpha subsp. ruderalis]|eukprot:PTQ46390.1 hypothetical protein MARPO_0011s0074 [Marchantia polymorpha]